MSDDSDEDSSQLLIKHLAEATDGTDSGSRLMLAVADTVKRKNTLLRDSVLRSILVLVVGIFGVLVEIPIGFVFAVAMAIIYFAYDYSLSKKNNKQLEKLLDLSADIDEKRQVLKDLNRQLQNKNKILHDEVNIHNQLEAIKEEKHRAQTNLTNITSYNNHLTNIIRGINHEVSPWLGSIGNIAAFAKDDLCEHIKNPSIPCPCQDLVKNLDDIKKAARQAADVLVLTSKNVKKLRNWSLSRSNLLDTINSWGYIALMENDIKSKLNEHTIVIDKDSLDFEASHSPMMVSQIILNLVKNSIDHNEHMIDDLRVKIYGNGENILYVEDNGKGIPDNILNDIFKPGVSTKKDFGLPTGLGLASNVDYCMFMRAKIKVESKVGKFTRFHIVFKNSSTDTSRRTKDDDIERRSAYYQIIKDSQSQHQNIIKKYPSCASIEVIPESDTKAMKRINEIDETLKKLN